MTADSPTPREPPPLAAPEAPIEPREIDTPAGRIWAAHAVYRDVHRHGRTHVAAARVWDATGFARIAFEPRAATLAVDRWAFLDVETTGLGTRTSTFAFLVGIGWIDAGALHIEQILLRDPSDEPALLHAVESRLAGFDGVLTFNGKTFDLPLLETRAALWRRAAPHAGRVHCDLLHAARRAWAHRTASCRLGVLERELLGVRRGRDLDGRFIPETFLDYLRTGRGALLDPILAHNRADLLSLVLLAAEAARFLARAAQGDPIFADPARIAEERWRAGEMLWRAGDEAGAVASLERCLAGAPEPGARRGARVLLAAIRKRQGDLDAACSLWEALVDEDPELVQPVEELAKAAEHARRDPTAALRWVDGRLGRAGLDAVSAAALAHRRGRLLRKVGQGDPFGAPGVASLGLPPDS